MFAVFVSNENVIGILFWRVIEKRIWFVSVFVAVAMSADEPCNLQCEPNNLPICVKDTKTNEKETMYNYCAMLQKNQCQGGCK